MACSLYLIQDWCLRALILPFFVQAIDLKPFGGVHIMLKDRSAAELAMGNLAEALEDAKEALAIAPNYPEDPCGDALMALDQVDAAEKSYSMALELDPSIRRSKSFKVQFMFVVVLE
ncbi:hypothetical protein RND71_017900 [Anisodus tanguticus]|uniref:Uncharacterized protein n=1 Tax=Anisodus tanguticus TaxID=243964 RepID=A0AAE1S4C4_9SOLA|nr:hypothetical protein RND71_017900 [Anisodus tanguticus]